MYHRNLEPKFKLKLYFNTKINEEMFGFLTSLSFQENFLEILAIMAVRFDISKGLPKKD